MTSNAEAGARYDTTTAERSWLLRLYVAGDTAKCVQAYANLKKVCEARSRRS